MQHDVDGPIPEGEGLRVALNDPDIRLVRLAGADARSLEQLRL